MYVDIPRSFFVSLSIVSNTQMYRWVNKTDSSFTCISRLVWYAPLPEHMYANTQSIMAAFFSFSLCMLHVSVSVIVNIHCWLIAGKCLISNVEHCMVIFWARPLAFCVYGWLLMLYGECILCLRVSQMAFSISVCVWCAVCIIDKYHWAPKTSAFISNKYDWYVTAMHGLSDRGRESEIYYLVEVGQ